MLEAHGERILQANYKPGFRTRLFAKDLRIASDTLLEHRTPAPVAAAVQQLVSALLADGKDDLDYSALATVLFDLAGRRRPVVASKLSRRSSLTPRLSLIQITRRQLQQ